MKYGQSAPRSIWRWRNRRHHQHHGAGAESSRRHGLGCPEVAHTAPSGLRSKLHLCGHLLEQPAPSVARRAQGERPRSLGQSPHALLVIAHTFHHDGARGTDSPDSRARHHPSRRCSRADRRGLHFYRVAESLPADPTESLVGRADAALYKSKEGGRNRITAANSG